jgi:hypothetical protein
MLWQNASATTAATRIPSPSLRHSRRRSARTVVAPGLRRQKAAKSCSPRQASAASFMTGTSRRRKYQSVSCLRTGSAAAGSSQTR